MAMAPERLGIGIRRHFTREEVDPYDEVTWERRDARITNFRDGTVAFEQLGVEVPSTWSVNATNILAQKYFRGQLGTPEREWSLKQVADRVVDTITGWGMKDGYFVDFEEAEAFGAELKYLIVNQRAAFNSPVWFNIGVKGVPAQASACFILAVDDRMDAILDWYKEEGTIFKGGSGSGINLSKIRSSKEHLNGGGTASGPVSFMRGADASAGTIKSGGKTRRAAKMVILNADHPDIEDFIWCKAIEERKARALADAGFDMDLDGKDSHSIQYQNANNSVRVTDDFMQAVVDDGEWHLRAVTTGDVVRTIRARDLMRQIAMSTWECADPGMQFDTTINRWHTAANTDRINASNPCCFVGDTLVNTEDGLLRFELLQKMADAGHELPMALSFDLSAQKLAVKRINRVWVAGHADRLVRVRTESGLVLECTPEHRFLTEGGRWVEAQALQPEMVLMGPDTDSVLEIEHVQLEEAVPVYDLEIDGTHNFAVSSPGEGESASVFVHNSEYMHLDNSACNLASLNLLRFLNDDGSFDTEGFKGAVEVLFTAQEILVGNADYPTEKIAETTRKFRQLGIGYANLGALLMAQGMAYDSDEGRQLASAITALMTGHAYATSARTAARMGPFAGYHDNAEHMLKVLRMHRDEVAKIDEEAVPTDLLSTAQEAWDAAVELAESYGVRNSQASVLAPTGTIGLLMDCDTTGIEPELGLVKMKKLVGGGTMSIVNHTVPRALTRLGYSKDQVDDIIAYIDTNKSILGAPHLTADHLSVFACSMGDHTIHHSGHIRMMGAVQPWISGAISKCVVGETLLSTSDGLVRIGSLHDGESPDTFRHEVLEVASVGGTQKTDSFYYGGVRDVTEVVLRSGHRVTGTPNHRLLVAGHGALEWRSLEDLEVGDYVATERGSELWSSMPARFDDFQPSLRHGSQKAVRIPAEMTDDLALLLGMYASEGHTTISNWTISITNSVESVLERAVELWQSVFGVTARISRDAGKCPGVLVSSKTIVEFLSYLGCGERASTKRIPDAVLRSPRSMVLAFLQGLALDAYVSVTHAPKWAICLDAPALLDDLQAVLTNLGVGHGRVTKLNKEYGKTYDEVYACGEQAQHVARLVPFLEPDKAARADALAEFKFLSTHATADVVPGISPYELYNLLPRGRSAETGRGIRTPFAFLCDPRTMHVTRRSLERVAAVPGVVLPKWLQTVLDDNLYFAPVESVGNAGRRPVYDISVPANQAFVANGIVNHNTVNLPEEATVDEVEQLHIDAWKLGLKAVAVYRDNCKVAQPLSTMKKEKPLSEAQAHDQELAIKLAELEKALAGQTTVVVKRPIRERLPRRRRSYTFAFRVADCEGYVTVGEYEDGRPGEVFMKVSKQGSTLAGVMDAFSISVSLGLQHGVPLKTYVQKYTNMRFEPAGMTDDEELRIASSLVDYIFRRLAVDYLPHDERAELGILTSHERTQPTLPGVDEATTPSFGTVEVPVAEVAPEVRVIDVRPPSQPVNKDAPFCYSCGNEMQRAGSCYVCSSCGATSGCS